MGSKVGRGQHVRLPPQWVKDTFIALASSPLHAVWVFGADFLWQVQEICPLGVGTSNCVIGDFGCFFIHVAGAVFRSCCWNFGRLRSIWGRLRSIWEVPSEVTLFGRRNTWRTWTMFWNLQKLVSWARRAKLRMPELHVSWQAQHTWKTSMKNCLRARSNIVFKCFWRVQLSFFVAHAIFGAFAKIRLRNPFHTLCVSDRSRCGALLLCTLRMLDCSLVILVECSKRSSENHEDIMLVIVWQLWWDAHAMVLLEGSCKAFYKVLVWRSCAILLESVRDPCMKIL